ncbi:amino acid permease [Microbacterium foliorum]|uniref:amino acid permease n=1 Tax=Microbacterium foliorum TaxID=104336 RepID=UPI001DE8B665|nr:Amino-acid permease RocC [Microbacterium foliorum]CAH0188094.1 Amino-acid permease RocC [Microbacterium foliorum]
MTPLPGEKSLPNVLPHTTATQVPLRRLQRTMDARHLIMIALGGVIGSGLFLSSGYTISQAGPLGAIIAYLIGAFVVYLVMACLGELAVAYPVSGAFHIYASRSIGPATGFTTAWLYWLCWVVALGSEFTASGILMQRWFPGVPVWLWCLIFAAVLFLLNAISARVFGEAEFWFSLVKVVAIVGLIVLGAAAIFGFTPLSPEHPPALLFSNFETPGGLFPNGFSGVIVTALAVFYAFSGSELIGVAAGETKDPAKNIPRALRSTVLRLVVLFVGAIAVIAAILPYDQASVTSSPFVDVFQYVGVPYAADIMNFVIITALLSAGNSGLFSCARMLFSLAEEGHAPKAFTRLTRRGVPLIALSVSILIGLVSLLTSVMAAGTVYLVLVSIAGFAVVAVWMSIVASQFFHRRRFVREGGRVQDLAYRTPLYPALPIVAFSLLLISIVAIAFDPNQVAALYFGIPFVGACYLYFWWRHGRRGAREVSHDHEAESVDA